jgi:hypothetical protein
MDNEQKKVHLNESHLWNYLLLDKEIRYSDFLVFFMEKYNYDPFNNKYLGKNIKITREKKQTDIWVDLDTQRYKRRREINQESENILEPQFIVENKLKSIPFVEQLEDYTKKFVDEYVNSIVDLYKVQENRDSCYTAALWNDQVSSEKLKKVINFKFHLIAPLKYEKLEPVFITMNSKNRWNIDTKLKFCWEQHTYSELGDKILKIIDDEKNKDHTYFHSLFTDFAKVLQSMTIFTDELQNFDLKQGITNSFSPSGIFRDFKNMHDFYGKYRSSQCAQELNERLNSNNEKIKTKHGFTNKSGLFEVTRKLDKVGINADEEITYIIQYQSGKLRKAMVMPKIKQGKNPYTNWFLKDWELNDKPIKFKPKDNGELYSYKSGSDDMFYYTCYNLGDLELITVENIIDLMIKYIQVDPKVNDMA